MFIVCRFVRGSISGCLSVKKPFAGGRLGAIDYFCRPKNHILINISKKTQLWLT